MEINEQTARKALAKRVAEKGDDLQYMTRVISVKNFFGEPKSLDDVKPGDMIWLSCASLPMEKLEGLTEWWEAPNLSEESSRLIMVSDIAQINGKFFIESRGTTYTSVEMYKEWGEARDAYKEQTVKYLAPLAVNEANNLIRPSIDKLMEVLNVDERLNKAGITTRGDKRSTYNAVVDALKEQIVGSDAKMTTDEITKRMDGMDMRELIDTLNQTVDAHAAALNYERDHAIAEELYKLHLPVYHFDLEGYMFRLNHNSMRPISEKLANPLYYLEQQFKGHNHSDGVELHMGIKPMTAMDTRRLDADFYGMKLLKVLTDFDNNRYYVTSNGVFTYKDIGDAYSDVLKEHGAWHPEFSKENMNLQRYASLITHGEESLTQKLADGSMKGLEEMLFQALRNDYAVNYIAEPNEYYSTRVTKHSLNGINIPQANLDSIFPGDAISIECPVEPMNVETGEKMELSCGKIDIVVDEIWQNDRDFIITTPDGRIFSNIKDVEEVVKGLTQEEELTWDRADD